MLRNPTNGLGAFPNLLMLVSYAWTFHKDISLEIRLEHGLAPTEY